MNRILGTVYDLMMSVAQDADPVTSGYQASLYYVVLCLLVPITLGVLVSAFVTVLEKGYAWFRSNR